MTRTPSTRTWTTPRRIAMTTRWTTKAWATSCSACMTRYSALKTSGMHWAARMLPELQSDASRQEMHAQGRRAHGERQGICLPQGHGRIRVVSGARSVPARDGVRPSEDEQPRRSRQRPEKKRAAVVQEPLTIRMKRERRGQKGLLSMRGRGRGWEKEACKSGPFLLATFSLLQLAVKMGGRANTTAGRESKVTSKSVGRDCRVEPLLRYDGHDGQPVSSCQASPCLLRTYAL